MSAQTLFNAFMPTQKKLGLGLQYIGSKEAIAPKIIQKIYEYLPNATHFFDLFGGGGAMSLCAVDSKLITHYNELKSDMCVMYSYVLDCIKNPRSDFGIFDIDCYQFCDRDEFRQIYNGYLAKKPLSPQQMIKRYVYSFNCKGFTYFKGKFREKFAKAGHIMVMSPYLQGDYKSAIEVFSDYFGNELGNDIRIIEKFFLEFCENPQWTALSLYKRQKVFTRFVLKLESLCIAQLLSNFRCYDLKSFENCKKDEIYQLISKYNPKLPKKQFKQSNERLEAIKGILRLEQTQHIERIGRFENIKALKQSFSVTNNSYIDFDFKQIAQSLNAKPNNLVIYCDIPYQDASSKATYKKIYHKNFDINQFIEWTKAQVSNGFKIFVSEYNNPAPQVFKEIYSISKQSNVSKDDTRIEKLFLASENNKILTKDNEILKG